MSYPDHVRRAIERLKAYEPPEGYCVGYSGGKDSVVIKALCDLAGVKYHAVYNVTSVDPPELVRFIKQQKDVAFKFPKDKEGKPVNMWSLIERKGYPPTRLVRYCCAELKETQNDSAITVTGVRWAESTNRAASQGILTAKSEKDKTVLLSMGFEPTRRGPVLRSDNVEVRRVFEHCMQRGDFTLNPIVDWSEDEVWLFIRGSGLPYCELYDEGFSRLGCIGCPMAGRKGRLRQFSRYPEFERLYKRSIEKMLVSREKRGLPQGWADVEDCWRWWLEEPVGRGQQTLGIFEEDT